MNQPPRKLVLAAFGFNFRGYDEWVSRFTPQHEPDYPLYRPVRFRPSSRATTARRSFRGERWPLSAMAVGGQFYAAPARQEHLPSSRPSTRGKLGMDLPRFHHRENVSRAEEELAAQIADAQAPFWRHVREALAKRHP